MKNSINRIRYFTALVKARPADPQQPVHQQIYLRALRTLPNLTIHEGEFLSNPVRMMMVHPPVGGPNTVEVWKTEEKGSDVNIATYLLLDAFDHDCEAAIVISNDSDLAEPIFQVRKRFSIKVIVLHPLRAPATGTKPRPSFRLVKAASKSVILQAALLPTSQFPQTLTDAHGTITKPVGWRSSYGNRGAWEKTRKQILLLTGQLIGRRTRGSGQSVSVSMGGGGYRTAYSGIRARSFSGWNASTMSDFGMPAASNSSAIPSSVPSRCIQTLPPIMSRCSRQCCTRRTPCQPTETIRLNQGCCPSPCGYGNQQEVCSKWSGR